MRTLFLNPPSYEGFDGGAGARYQAKREIRSYWYPTWLAQPAALVPDSMLVDAPPAGLTLADVLPLARRLRPGRPAHELAHLRRRRQGGRGAQGGQPGAARRVRRARRSPCSPSARCGPRRPSTSWPGRSSTSPSPRWPRAAPLASVDGISYRIRDGQVVHNADREHPGGHGPPAVRDAGLQAGPAARGLLHRLPPAPVRLAVHRAGMPVAGARSACGRRPSAGTGTGPGASANVLAEAALARQLFPQMKELFFDDDTFTDDRRRAEAIARGLGQLGITWSCNAKANVPARHPEGPARTTGCACCWSATSPATSRSSINIKKGLRVDRARRFAARLPGTRDHRARDVHPRPARGDQGNHPGDDPLRPRGQPAHHPGLGRGALPGHRAVPAGHGERLAARGRRRRHAGQRGRHPARGAVVPAPGAHRDPGVGGRVLQAVLLPGRQDRRDVRRDAPPARAWPPGGCARAASSSGSWREPALRTAGRAEAAVRSEALPDACSARPSQRADVLGDLPAARAARPGAGGRGRCWPTATTSG